MFKKKEKEVKTWDDLKGREVPSGCIINISAKLNGIDYTWVFASATDKGLFINEKHAKSALAMAQISQLMPYYVGAITDEEWDNDRDKYCIERNHKNLIYRSFVWHEYHILAFHTEEQRDDFLKYNEQLVKDYLMIE